MKRTRVTRYLVAVAFTAGVAAGGPQGDTLSLGPPSYELLRSSIDCGGSVVFRADSGDCGDCDLPDPKGPPGCSDQVCQGIVCSLDPYCCFTAWDSTCAVEAQRNCDCPSEFQLIGTIGQADTGVMSGGGLVLAGGFWAGGEISCPWDCEPVADGIVGINDFLALLGQWGMVGTSCDFTGEGVDRSDLFIQLLANWGPCQ